MLKKEVRENNLEYDEMKSQMEAKVAGIRKMCYGKLAEVKIQRKQEMDVYENEQAIMKEMVQQMTEHRDKMFQELSMAKQMLLVPRLHFKNIEKCDYETLCDHFRKFLDKIDSLQTAPGQWERFRLNEILQKDKPLIEDKL